MDHSELTAAHIWEPAAWLQVSGPDAFRFLQGQFTNDLRLLDDQPAVYGLWLNEKGKVQGDSFILPAEGKAFWLGSYFSPAKTLVERLKANLVADDATIEDCTAGCRGLTLIGAAASEMMEKFGGALKFPGRRAAVPCMELMFATEAQPAVEARMAELNLLPLPASEMELFRIQASITSVPREIGPDDLPNEGGLDAVAISYTKGCYLGQEVMARLKSMGQVRRQLLRVTGAGAPPVLPADLYNGTKRMGELRSAAVDGEGFVGFALLSLLGLDRCPGLSYTPQGEAAVHLVEIKTTRPPW
jgi:folate-binding protein YgfZ